MSDNVYKLIEVTGTSKSSLEDAIEVALARAGRTVRQMRWFEVTEIRGSIDEDKVAQWQVSLKIGFNLED